MHDASGAKNNADSCINIDIVYEINNNKTLTFKETYFTHASRINVNANNSKHSFLPNMLGSYTGKNRPPGENIKNKNTNSGVPFKKVIIK